MIKTLSQRCAPRWVCLLLMLIASMHVALAQNTTVKKAPSTKTTAKPKAKQQAVTNKIQIINDKSFVSDQAVPNNYALPDTFAYSQFMIPLTISGKTPKNDVQVKLVIDDRTLSANPKFYGTTGLSTSINISISKDTFSTTGASKNILSPPVTIRYNKKNAGGYAYISISNQQTENYYKAIFYSHAQDPADTTVQTKGSSTPAPGNITSKKITGNTGDTITMINGSYGIKLDTVLSVIRQYPFTIKFKMKYEIKHKIKVAVTNIPLLPLQNVALYKDDADTLTFDVADWSAKAADSTTEKPYKLSLQQTKQAVAEQAVTIQFPNGKTKFVATLSQGKATAGTLNLVTLGNVTIIPSKKIGITHEYNSSINSIDTITVKVKLHGNYDPDHNQLFFTLLDSANLNLSKHFKIHENPITITKDEWNNMVMKIVKRPGKKDTTLSIDSAMSIFLHIQSVNLPDSLNKLDNINMVLKGQTQSQRGSQIVKVSIKDIDFWAEGGTNFSLLDNIKTNNFYAGVYGFPKDIGRIGWFGRNAEQQKHHNLSITGGVYESQSVGTNSTSKEGIVYRDINKAYRDTGAVSATTSVKTIGILFSPHLKLTNGKTDANGLHLFLSLYTELLWQTVNSNFNYQSANPAVSVTNPTYLESLPFKEASLSYDFRSHYEGLGLPIYIKENEFTLYVNDVVGLTNQRYYVNSAANFDNDIDPSNQKNYTNYLSDLTFLKPKSRLNGFLLFQYRLTDVAYGVTFSGEIRELMIRDAKPVVSLALSKKFDLSKLLSSLFAAVK